MNTIKSLKKESIQVKRNHTNASLLKYKHENTYLYILIQETTFNLLFNYRVQSQHAKG